MNLVFVLEHLHLVDGDEEDLKMLGVYSTRENALAAVERFRKVPGFRDVPQMAEHTDAPGNPEGFHLNERLVDQDGWPEGYVTL